MNEEPKRLVIPADLEAEAEALANKMRVAATAAAQRPQVMVSIALKSGNIRRNGPCPCGSGRKYKKCCLDKVDDGFLPRLRRGGRPQQPPTKYDARMRDRRSKYDARMRDRRSKYGRKGSTLPDEGD